VLIVDEWESADQFQQFFGDLSLQEFVAAVGGDTSTPPEITVCEAIESPTNSDLRASRGNTSLTAARRPVARRGALTFCAHE
jgi:hypothetical protein